MSTAKGKGGSGSKTPRKTGGASRKATPTPKRARNKDGTWKPSKRPAPKASPAKRQAPPPLRLIVQSQRTKSGRADRYRYPKGHAKAGQYAPNKLASNSSATRYKRDRHGRREEVRPTGKGRGRSVKSAPIGRGFTERSPSYSVVEAAREAADKGRSIYVKVGGKILKIPKSRANDAAAMFLDISAHMRTVKPTRRGMSTPMIGIELSYGPSGILVNLDKVDFFDEELREEIGSLDEDRQLSEGLSNYVSRATGDYLGNTIDPEDIRAAWGEGDDDDSVDDFDERDDLYDE